MPKVPSALEVEIAGEKAASLGRAGRRLRAALERLRRFDSGAAKSSRAGRAGGEAETRAELIAQAGEAYWSYIVQREALGLIDRQSIIADYGIPPEVERSMGPRLRTPS